MRAAAERTVDATWKAQEDSSNDSRQTNAATTSSTQDTLQHEII
jgi:hypothetical protein